MLRKASLRKRSVFQEYQNYYSTLKEKKKAQEREPGLILKDF